jgi:hypothetical protein
MVRVRGIGRSGIGAVGLALALMACVPEMPPPINSPAFARRPPSPGQPGYLETIKFIDDGIHYTWADGAFFISAAGEMCFQGPVNISQSALVNPENYWCVDPLAVGSVDALQNGVSNVNAVRLWCRLSAPQCAHKIGYPNMLDEQWISNSITASTVPYRRQQAAIVHLIYLMGGDARGAEASRF